MDVRLRLLRHEHNTTYRVDADGGPCVLRIGRRGVHTCASVGSEMDWLAALGRDTALAVPQPVAARDGSFVVAIRDPGTPEPHICVLLRWLDGRFVDRRLAPAHMQLAGALAARLHDHAQAWRPPSGFIRPRVDTLTGAAKAESMAPSIDAARRADHPTAQDGDRARRRIEALVSSADADMFARRLEVIRSSTRALADDAGSFGLIHGEALFVLRRMQILLWVLESRDHPAFRDSWRTWVRQELDAISC